MAFFFCFFFVFFVVFLVVFFLCFCFFLFSVSSPSTITTTSTTSFSSFALTSLSLAGSRSLRTSGEALREAQAINKSLAALCKTIRVLADAGSQGKDSASVFIAYRESNLTRFPPPPNPSRCWRHRKADIANATSTDPRLLLRNSLGGTAKIILVCSSLFLHARYARICRRARHIPGVVHDAIAALTQRMGHQLAAISPSSKHVRCSLLAKYRRKIAETARTMLGFARFVVEAEKNK
eukprot:251997-Rhodomonas_salina.2